MALSLSRKSIGVVTFETTICLPRSGQHVRLQPCLDSLAIALGLDAPILAAQEIGHGRKHIEGVASGRRDGGVGRGRAMQIEAEIIGQRLALEQILQQFAIAGTHQDGVVADVIIMAIDAEIPDEQAHGIFGPVELGVGPAPARARGNEMAIGPGRIGVRNDDVGGEFFAALSCVKQTNLSLQLS